MKIFTFPVYHSHLLKRIRSLLKLKLISQFSHFFREDLWLAKEVPELLVTREPVVVKKGEKEVRRVTEDERMWRLSR